MGGGRWGGVEPATADPITSLAAALKEDPHPDKVGLCQGKYLLHRMILFTLALISLLFEDLFVGAGIWTRTGSRT